MAESFADDLLVSSVCSHVDADPSLLSFELSSTGKFNTTYFVHGAEIPLVLRIAPPDDAGFIFYEENMMAQEPGIHKIIRERTSAPVAEIIAYDTSRAHIPRDYLLMERLPGNPLSNLRVSEGQFDVILKQIGRFLREIHEITTERYGYLGEHHCMEPQDDWVSAFFEMWNRMVDDVVFCGFYDADEESFVRGLLKRYLSHFDRPVTSRLLHMDVWSQNILVDERGGVSGLIDFDRALWGDKEIEFAVLDYCGISEPAFWEGYGGVRDSSLSAQIRRVFYLAYEVQKYIVIRYRRGGDAATAESYKRQSLGLLGSLPGG